MFRVEKGARIIDTKEVNHCVESKSKFAIYFVQTWAGQFSGEAFFIYLLADRSYPNFLRSYRCKISPIILILPKQQSVEGL
jgi:hypothetical protein